MTDPVNNPSHYNQNGIEVIDVIETYAKEDFRLANVIKYVCRSGYKGNQVQDLRKAQWYLERVLAELDPVVDDTENNAWLRGYNEGYEDGEADYKTPAKCLDEFKSLNWEFPETGRIVEEPIGSNDYRQDTPEECLPVDEWRNKSGYSPREVDVFFQGYECKEQELAEEECRTEDGRCSYTGKPVECEEACPLPALDAEYHPAAHHHEFLATLPADRIAGDDDAAKRIKDAYYGFDRHSIKGYCANCDKEIGATQPHIVDAQDFNDGIIFCTAGCLVNLKEWQGR